MSNVISFAARKAAGDSHEERVHAELVDRGWVVDRYGQGLLSGPTQRALGLTDSRMRWESGHGRLVGVDGLSHRRERVHGR